MKRIFFSSILTFSFAAFAYHYYPSHELENHTEKSDVLGESKPVFHQVNHIALKKAKEKKVIKRRIVKKAVLRKSVTQRDLNEVIFSKNKSVAKKEKLQASKRKYGKIVSYHDKKNLNSNSKWVEELSGVSAQITVKKKVGQDCNDQLMDCANIDTENPISLVGLVVKSQATEKGNVNAKFSGRLKAGSYVEGTPLVYAE